MGPRPLGHKEIDSKASSLLTDDLITSLNLHRKSGSCQTIHTRKHCWFSLVVIFEALFGCHDVLILDKSPIIWRQRLDMTISC